MIARRMPTVAVDAAGGDFGPEMVVRGVAQASLETEIQCVLVGDEGAIQGVLDRATYNPELISIVPARDAIGMEEEPRQAVRAKRDASILVAARLVADGRADALVSAGNTGACILACARSFGVIPGIHRTALASVYPRQIRYPGQDPLAIILDVGATIHCEAVELVQFALMGHAYARRVSKVEAPRVGLLNMGREATKGGPALVEAHRRLHEMPDLNFIGNIEGHDLATGEADVVVCEGLVGNAVLKFMEGMADVFRHITGTAAQDRMRWRMGLALLGEPLRQAQQLTDYTRYGGAPILGFDRVFIKCHGRSNDHAVRNAVKIAAKAVRDQVPGEIADAVAGMSS
jgi:glycerol-3-phosphate acyltransferase PlsX